jgi:hypothetical protein
MHRKQGKKGCQRGQTEFVPNDNGPPAPLCANCHRSALTGGWTEFGVAQRWCCTTCTGNTAPHPLVEVDPNTRRIRTRARPRRALLPNGGRQ